MAVKNAVTEAVTIVLSGDGRRWSAWPLGDKPGTAPIIYAINNTAGPTSGGENNLGAYLTIAGWNLGRFADWGVTNHLYIGGVEVANYRCLDKAPGSGVAGMGNGVYETWGLMCLTVQVGSLGGMAAGTVANITGTVNGHAFANPTSGGAFLDYSSGDPLTFTVQPGPIIFVDVTNGNDANPGTFALPKKTLMSSGAIGGTGALRGGSSSTDTTGTVPGTHVYIMGGTYSSSGTLAQGIHGCWANFFRLGGLAATGATNRGPIVIMGYPGAAGANSRPAVVYDPGTGVQAGGGFLWNDSARAQETDPFDGVTVGRAKYMQLSHLKVVSAADAGGDSAPFNFDSRADFARIFFCEAVWKTTVTDAAQGANAHARGGGVCGNGRTIRVGACYIHDIYGDPAWLENHGIYLDGSIESTNGAYVSLCVFKNITGGNGMQTYNSAAPDYIQNVYFHNNWVETVAKNGLNLSDNTRSCHHWNNVVIDTGEYPIYYSSAASNAANSLSVENCVIYGWGRNNSLRPAVGNPGNSGTGSTLTRNCIIVQKAGYPTSGGFTSLDSGGTNNLDHNQWYDENGVMTTRPAGDTTGAVGNPLFTAPASKDFSLQATSPCIDAGAATSITRSFDFLGFQVTGTPDRGAFEYGAHL